MNLQSSYPLSGGPSQLLNYHSRENLHKPAWGKQPPNELVTDLSMQNLIRQVDQGLLERTMRGSQSPAGPMAWSLPRSEVQDDTPVSDDLAHDAGLEQQMMQPIAEASNYDRDSITVLDQQPDSKAETRISASKVGLKPPKAVNFEKQIGRDRVPLNQQFIP